MGQLGRFGTGIDRPGKRPEDYALVVRVVDVTPEMAEEWLTQNIGNRKDKPTAIAKYGRDMAAGAWLLTGAPIVFDSDGFLRDGQNRLYACVESGATFTTFVLWGVLPSAFAAMDRNVARSVSDILGIAGEANANQKCAVLTYIWREKKGMSLRAGGMRTMTVHDAQQMIEEHPELPELLHWYHPLSKAFLKPPALGPYLFWRLSQINPDKAKTFFTKVAYGEDLKINDPIHSLRSVLADGFGGRGSGGSSHDYHQEFVKLLVMATWRCWNNGKQITPNALKREATRLGVDLRKGTVKFASVA